LQSNRNTALYQFLNKTPVLQDFGQLEWAHIMADEQLQAFNGEAEG
jgi:hypothetical protein